MRLLQLVLGGTCAVMTPGCILIDQLLEEEEESCGGNALNTHESRFSVPNPLVSAGNFSTGVENGERYLRWSTDYTNVCSEEHAIVNYQVHCNGYCRPEGDYTTFPLFGDTVTLNGITGENLTIYSGRTEVGLKQHYEGGPGMFSAGLIVYILEEADPAIVSNGAIAAQFRDAPP